MSKYVQVPCNMTGSTTRGPPVDNQEWLCAEQFPDSKRVVKGPFDMCNYSLECIRELLTELKHPCRCSSP